MALSDKYIQLPETRSTNTAMRQMLETGMSLPHGSVVYTHRQTAGRGQRGNSWEAAPGENVTMSLLLRPESVDAAGQFAISEAVALGVARCVEALVGCQVKVKWPNDIYVGDRKIAGILIENTIEGRRIVTSVAGIGLNVNQTKFLSDAPNPVSMAQLTGSRYDVEEVMGDMVSRILGYMAIDDEQRHSEYMSSLWRADGYYEYQTPEGERFEAKIGGVAPTGHITLVSPDGQRCVYAFKEVMAVL